MGIEYRSPGYRLPDRNHRLVTQQLDNATNRNREESKMAKLQKPAQAGTLESSDMLVSIAPAAEGAGVKVNLTSPTLQQYGEHIKGIILTALMECGVTNADVDANDKGAVDFVIEARVKTAVQRAFEA